MVIAVASVIAGCAGEGAGDQPQGAGLVRDGVVTRVDDGDTIEVEVSGQAVEVRLVAVNAPDRGECFAERSLNHLIETVRDHVVTLEVVGEDQFGRTLAHVFEGERHVNLEMVDLGHAFASTPEEDDPHAEAILRAEEEAYSSGRGLWAIDACGSEHPAPEVMIDPDRSDIDPDGPDASRLDDETIAIRNDGREALDLSGWIFRDESTRHRFTFPPGTTIAPGERVVVASSDPGWAPGRGAVWNNDGDMALLQLPDGTVVSRWRYRA
jgi:endonuclease YncB( thermonuclease family)